MLGKRCRHGRTLPVGDEMKHWLLILIVALPLAAQQPPQRVVDKPFVVLASNGGDGKWMSTVR